MEDLIEKQLRYEAQCTSQARRRLETALARAAEKKGFSNTTVARLFKEDKLFKLIEAAGAQFVLDMLANSGERQASHIKMFRHFIESYTALCEVRGIKPKKDVTQLIHLKDWVYIGLNKMLDAAAMPKANDYKQRKTRSEMRSFDEKNVIPERPSVQKIQKEIGQMILFQTKLQFAQMLWGRWFQRKEKEATKRGSAGLRYYQRDMNEAIDSLIADLQLKAADCEEEINCILNFEKLPHLDDDTFCVVLGSWVYGLIFDNLPIFKEVQPDLRTPNKLEFLDSKESILSDVWDKVLGTAFLKRPMLAPPLPLTAEKRGGRFGSKDQATLKTSKGHTEMAPLRVDFFNRQASVPFKLNRWIYDLLSVYVRQEQPLGSFDHFYAQEIRRPSERLSGKPREYSHWDEQEQLQWCKHHPEWRNVNRQVSKEREAQIIRIREAKPSHELYQIATEMVDQERFWLPVRPEFRTRLLVDSLYLNYQGRDAGKALLKLANPVSIVGAEKETRFWVANQLASTYGSSLDKLEFSKRINTVESREFQDKIKAVALMLEENHSWSLGNDVLKEVDAGDGKPALFAAACREWYELFMAPSPKTTTDLIVSNDCSCSGQQFAAGWRRSKTLARATNCIESDEIHDLYSDVYKNMMERILCDEAGNISTRHEREMRLKGLGRSIVKGGIQPSMYGAGEETAITGVKAKIDKFSKKGLKLSDVERALIVNHYQPAVNEVCEMNTMNQWFREVARALGDNKAESILIPTPVGDTIEIVYSQLKGMKVSTFRYGTQRYKAKTKSVTLVEPNGKPDVKKWVSSLSANTTHGAGDASQLCLALNDAPFDFVTCHDSVGCAAPHMNELRRRMKEAYVKVVSFPLFDEILKANNLVAGQKMVNPIIGDWDPTEALRSTYLLS